MLSAIGNVSIDEIRGFRCQASPDHPQGKSGMIEERHGVRRDHVQASLQRLEALLSENLS